MSLSGYCPLCVKVAEQQPVSAYLDVYSDSDCRVHEKIQNRPVGAFYRPEEKSERKPNQLIFSTKQPPKICDFSLTE
jgi:hypothetical protein